MNKPITTRRVPYALPKRRRNLIDRALAQRRRRKFAKKLWMLKIAEALGVMPNGRGRQ